MNLEYGMWPNGAYVVFRPEDKTEMGTVEWGNVIKTFPTLSEARKYCEVRFVGETK